MVGSTTETYTFLESFQNLTFISVRGGGIPIENTRFCSSIVQSTDVIILFKNLDEGTYIFLDLSQVKMFGNYLCSW